MPCSKHKHVDALLYLIYDSLLLKNLVVKYQKILMKHDDSGLFSTFKSKNDLNFSKFFIFYASCFQSALQEMHSIQSNSSF